MPVLNAISLENLQWNMCHTGKKLLYNYYNSWRK